MPPPDLQGSADFGRARGLLLPSPVLVSLMGKQGFVGGPSLWEHRADFSECAGVPTCWVQAPGPASLTCGSWAGGGAERVPEGDLEPEPRGEDAGGAHPARRRKPALQAGPLRGRLHQVPGSHHLPEEPADQGGRPPAMPRPPWGAALPRPAPGGGVPAAAPAHSSPFSTGRRSPGRHSG